ncbi:MAG TPA: NfeD family protein [Acidimicrobiales bacterium]|nr:NfeD family protein [Acidimicrobiales bacterium]
MNTFLWIGVGSTLVLLASIVVDSIDGMIDALDLGSGWLSLPAVAAFVAAFGFGAGALVEPLGPVAVLPGIAAGVAFGWLAVRLTAAASGLRTDSTDSEPAMLGSLGTVLTPPTPERYGEVLLTRPAGPVKVACTAGRPLAPGTEIVVVDVTSSTLVTVEPFEPGLLRHDQEHS